MSQHGHHIVTTWSPQCYHIVTTLLPHCRHIVATMYKNLNHISYHFLSLVSYESKMVGEKSMTSLIDTISKQKFYQGKNACVFDDDWKVINTAFSRILQYYECRRCKTELTVPFNITVEHIIPATMTKFTSVSTYMNDSNIPMIRLLSILDIEDDKSTLCEDEYVYDAVINYDKYVRIVNKYMKWKYLKLNRLDEVRRKYIELGITSHHKMSMYEICTIDHPKVKINIDTLEKIDQESALLTAIKDTMEELDMDISDPVCQYSTIEDLMAYLKQLKEKVGVKDYDPHIVEIDEDYNKIFYGIGCRCNIKYGEDIRDIGVYSNGDDDGWGGENTRADEYCDECDRDENDCDCKVRYCIDFDNDVNDSEDIDTFFCVKSRPTIHTYKLQKGGESENYFEDWIPLERADPINSVEFQKQYGVSLYDARKAFFMVLKGTMYYDDDRYCENEYIDNTVDYLIDNGIMVDKKKRINAFHITADRKTIEYEYMKRDARFWDIDPDFLDFTVNEKKYLKIVSTVMGYDVDFSCKDFLEVKAKYYEISCFPVKIVLKNLDELRPTYFDFGSQRNKKILYITPYTDEIIGDSTWRYEDIRWYENATRNSKGVILGHCKRRHVDVVTLM